jgi:predicted dehydrogenase/threonine dehydrogenase-like Zn-dependent dehydrogenase
MKQVLVRQGRAVVEEVPAPRVEAGGVLVRVDHSCISVGTELSGIRASGTPLWKRALRQPDNVKRVVEMVATQGLGRARATVQGKLAAGNATGYSAAGVVEEVGAGVDDLRPGDRVACAGGAFAYHAELIRVPRNLVVPVPEGLGFLEASTVTLGAIALQGVRRAQPTMGETFVVIGLGILGQITAQLLRAHGCRVIGMDLDPARVALARGLGMEMGLDADAGDPMDQVGRLTGGIGADGVIVTAATPSDAVMSTAFGMCRRKGRVVLVGDVGLNLNRADIYAKELEFLISTSYGPGRYDARYEEEGLDYPVAYVRWTENRNMGEYLRLLAAAQVRLGPLLSAVYPVERATEAYEMLQGEGDRPLVAVLSYPPGAEAAAPLRRVPNPQARAAAPGRIRIAVVGAGGFAKGMHLPNLQSLPDRFHVQAVVSRTGHNASDTAAQFGARYATTDLAEVLADPEVDALLIATPHDLHAGMALQGVRAGKHVLVEKPLALHRGEMRDIEEHYAGLEAGAPAPVLLTGFNRRFSPFAARMAELVAGRTGPMVMSYRMNAGYLPLDHWVHSPSGGGRNIGEACHIYDLFTFLAGSEATAVSAHAARPATGYYTGRDNFVAAMSFRDGSVATLAYTALGASEHPKEQMEVFVDGKVLRLDDYRTLTVAGAKARGVETRAVDKGQRDELVAFADAIQRGGAWPIPLWQQLQAMEISFRVEELISPPPPPAAG